MCVCVCVGVCACVLFGEVCVNKMNTTISENKCYEGNKTGLSERFGYSGLEKG